MSQVLVAGGSVYGPFESLVELPDHWVCDGTSLPKSVIGPAVLHTYTGQSTLSDAGVPQVAVPATVTMRQARIALFRAGKLESVPLAISALPEPHKTEAAITWEFSQEVQRANGFVSQLGPALGLNEAAIDNLFITASTL